MLRLTILLLAAMFVTALVGGRDYGQMRPGLMAAATAPARQEPAPAAVPEPTESDVVAVAYTPPEPVQTTPQIVTLVQPAPTEAPDAMPVALADEGGAMDVLYVNARAVNVREGPSTDYGIIGTLSQGEAATLVWEEPNGWARIRIEGDGIEGFVAMRLLTRDPASN